MKIRTQFIISAVFLGVILLVVSAAVIITSQKVSNTYRQETLSTQIERQAYELGYLANDYLLYRESQQASRWESKFASFSNDLSKMDLNTPEQLALLAKIENDQQRLKTVFAEVRASFENEPKIQEGGINTKLMQTSWSRLEVLNQGIIFEVSRLTRMLREQEARLRQVTSLLSFVLVSVLGVFLLGNYGLIFRRLLNGIVTLQAGTRIIGSGDLDFAIAVNSEDEIGELSRAFNQMTANLKQVTTSKADLEKEIAERKRAEDNLEHSNQKLNEILVSIQDDFYVLDYGWKFVYASRLFTGKVGKEPKDFIGKNIWEMFPKHVGTILEENFRAAMEKREVRRFELGGKYTAARYRMTAFPSAEGITVIGTDITEQKRAEEALQRSEAMLLETGKVAKVGGWELDLQTKQLVWTLETYRIHEVDASLQPDLEGAINFYAPESRLQISEAVRLAIEEGQSYDLELPLITAKGRNIWIRTVGHSEFREGKCVRLFGMFQDITERRQAEEGLRRFELLSANSKDIILFIRQDDGCILEVNAAAVQVYGYNRDELLTLTISDLRAPDARSLTADQMTQAATNGILFESVHLRKDGSTFPVEVSSQGATLGGVRALISIVRDITERKQAEVELIRLASFPEKNPNPVLEVGYSGDIVYFNPISRKLFPGIAESGLKHPILAGLEHLIQKFKEKELEKVIIQEVKADDAYYHQSIVNIPESGRIRLYNVDITDLKHAEEMLLDAELQKQAFQYARTLLETSLDPLVTISPEGKITDVNEATIKATGVPRKDLIGTNFSDYFTEPEKAEQGYKQVFNQGYATDYPLTIRHRNGLLMEVLYNASLYKDARGNVLGAFAAARDVTILKQAEAELKNHKENLELLVKERTSELEESNRALARSNENLEQFAYVASHDLQEPLRIMASYSQLLERRYKGRLDADADDFIGFIVEAAGRMQKLITDLLAYSRAGREATDLVVVDCNKVLSRLVTSMAVTIENAGGAVTFDPLPSIMTHETSLIQLFQNLIGNALKFRCENPPKIHISVRKNDHEWIFSVQDNGIGLEPQYSQRIFMIFQRLHPRDKYPGTGIGLSICKKIVENMGGRIWVESEQGKGSTFYFTVPLKITEAVNSVVA